MTPNQEAQPAKTAGMRASIETVPARLLVPGDVFSTDGYHVEIAVTLYTRGEVWVEARRADDPCAKTAYLPLDFPCPLWRGAEV